MRAWSGQIRLTKRPRLQRKLIDFIGAFARQARGRCERAVELDAPAASADAVSVEGEGEGKRAHEGSRARIFAGIAESR